MASEFRRDKVVFYLIVIGFLAVAVRAFYVQVLKTDFLRNEGDKRHVRNIEIPAPRGEIYDRNGMLLALSTPMASVWVDPKILLEYDRNYRSFLNVLGLNDAELVALAEKNRDKKLSFITQVNDSERLKILKELQLPGVYLKLIEMTLQRDGRKIVINKESPSLWVDMRLIERYRHSFALLAQVLGEPVKVVRKKIESHDKRRFLYLKRSLQPQIAERIDQLNLYGVYTQDEYKRYYPAAETSSHLIGFTNIDDRGLEGVELAYEDWLSGQPGKKQVIKDRAGHVVDFVRDVKASEAGKPIVLSLDERIQHFAYKALKETMIKHQARSAVSVVLDAKTGEILSMVSLPGYNPNDSSQRKGRAIRNRVITDLIEPGSTIKPFVIAKALDEGVITTDTVIDTAPGSVRIQGERITDTHNYGELTPHDIIEKSSNVGASKIALKLTAEQQREFWKELGFGQESGLYLPGENNGYLKPAQQWQPIDQASASFGYGFNINILSLAHAYLLFANRGEMLPLSLIKLQQPPQGVQLVKPQSAFDVLSMMESVVSKKGTAPLAQVPGYRVAGKTGTVHKTSRGGGYQQNTYMSLFAGVVPVSDPNMVMVVAINEPARGIYYGGAVAAPVFKEVMEQALRLRNVPPDQVETETHLVASHR
ncbi:peptidoglycan D,D-transpeptidase FtsI family protein [Thiomicrorhabdus heinhorstiae]|uniref:Peptidoglycan D,D-transpeptidase FtsI n=1 Tax=Thiomicrorhabdus heinhorstiae TaxID=2748010 RepID=A0ABS0BXN4_9GAMM|nr:penicillin-binding protein 2 [Thiomicrorhabdus heinhorstiae]MBF6058558.1 penicillin-binding protein 2 [Thiomicrorhabdus heinhorstiae]